MLLGGCADDLTRDQMTPPAPSEESMPAARPTDLNPTSRFSIELRAAGRLVPNAPIALHTNVVANLKTEDAEIAIWLPEVAAARLSGWGKGYRVPAGEALPREGVWQASMGRGQRQQHQAVIRIPEPGYYRVVASAFGRTSGSQEPAKHAVQDFSQKELWLWIDSGGGRITEEFDPTVFPAGAVQQPGPLRHHGSLKLGGSHAAAAPTEGQRAASASCWIGNLPCTASLAATYPVKDASYVEHFANAKVWLRYSDRDAYGNPVTVRTSTQYTDSQGRYSVDCSMHSYYTNNVVVDGYIETRNGNVWIERGDGGQTALLNFNHQRVYDVCEHAAHGYEYVYDLSMPYASEARVFSLMSTAIPVSRSAFGISRGPIKVKVYPYEGGSNYSSWPDDIQMYENAVWKNYGRFAISHEYGHALHEKALGGIIGRCDGDHALDAPNNHACAFFEGFADLHAVLTDGTKMVYGPWDVEEYSRKAAEQTWATYPGGALTEGKIGAFFYDLADGPSAPDGISGDDDSAVYGAGYVATVIRDCYITWTEDTTFGNADGTVQTRVERARDSLELPHCFERAVSPGGRAEISGVDKFGNIIRLRATSVSAPGADGWSPSAVASAWTQNVQ